MYAIRRSHERGKANHGWLDARHSFSFGNYYDPAFMGFGPLRVINEDRIAPQSGFDTHGHRDMEIVTYLVDGALEHKDSMGNGSILRKHAVQRMTAGTGVLHSEHNPLDTETTHLLQIWILPERAGLKPGYEEQIFDPSAKRDRLLLLASRDGRDGALTIHQDVDLYAAMPMSGTTLTHTFRPDRKGWLQVVDGALAVAGIELGAGDGLALDNPGELRIEARDDAEFLLFDMA